MKKITDLIEPSNDAISYNTDDRRQIFLKVYDPTYHFKQLQEKGRYFIIGDKGSGKTALALYFQLNCPQNSSGKLLPITTTQYKKFILLKINKKLEYSDYASIWRSTLLMLVAQFVQQKGKKWIHKVTVSSRKSKRR